MSLKKTISLFVALVLLLCALPLSVGAAQNGEDVKAMVEALPSLDAVKVMPLEQQQQAYSQTQAAYDAYQALTDEERAVLEGAEKTFEELFTYFNTLVMPLEEAQSAQVPEEKEEGIPWGITALILALITTFLQNKFIHGRRR